MLDLSKVPFEPYYEKDGIVIYNADCRQVLPFLPKFDLLLTDPPYGIGEGNQKRILSRSKVAAARDYGDSNWDDKPVYGLEVIVGQYLKAVVWGGNYYNFPPTKCLLVWDKDNGENDFADCEIAWTNFDKAVRKFKWRWAGMLQEKGGDKKEARQHPTQKPLSLMSWCIKQAGECETILDPFMGSGTTLVAAKQEGKKAVGIELEEKYCEVAVNRLAQNVLFGGESNEL